MFLNSVFSRPSKPFVQYVLILTTDPHLKINLCTRMHESVVKKFAISRCIARLARQVNMTHPPPPLGDNTATPRQPKDVSRIAPFKVAAGWSSSDTFVSD
ncbi:hypothetical protein XENORESO_021561 [Xenotaenia resolanae]|uniref:Uncharacterized protein n=1 Tax=Xenotaenia resolanae TaxID=208358 RepID=A0ABV0WCM4_9TELE